MKDIDATLRRLDEKIVAHQNQIRLHQVAIADLQTARLTLAGVAEEDRFASQVHREERQGVISGSHARPMLIVRKVGSEELAERAMASTEGLNSAGNRRGMNNTKGTKIGTNRKGGRNDASAMGKMRSRIETTLSDGEPMNANELGNFFGIPSTGEARKSLQNALYNMRVTGVLYRDPDKRYSLAKLRPPVQ